MSTNTVQVYVPLLNEGTDVLRPTSGVVVDRDVVRIEPTPNYDPESEEWEFPPGSQVRCRRENRGGSEILVARQLVA
jgi:hypothetical protein